MRLIYRNSIEKIIHKKNSAPMQYFTSEENPSEKTLNIIRQIAHTYRVVENNGSTYSYCLN